MPLDPLHAEIAGIALHLAGTGRAALAGGGAMVGAVLHPDELAADKTLALFGRASARDLVDVDALLTRYGRDRLLELAAEKDPGFSPSVFADALAAAAARPAAAFSELGLSDAQAARLRERAEVWRGAID